MRIAAIAATMLFALASCSTTEADPISPFQQPNQLMSGEINRRIEQIPYQHREELLQNLLWLAQTGEQTIPALLEGMSHDNAKVRSSCAWVLGRLRDRRTIPGLQAAMRDSEPGVRMEIARTLVLMGDLKQSPTLIEGLDSERKEVRFLCHEALKTATGHDFGYDHLNQNTQELQVATLRWRQWWSEYSGDQFFASDYAKDKGIGAELAAPGGEVQMIEEPNGNESSDTTPQPAPVENEMPNENATVESVEMPATEVPAEVPSAEQPMTEEPSNEPPATNEEPATHEVPPTPIEVPSSTGEGNGEGNTPTVIEVPADPNGSGDGV